MWYRWFVNIALMLSSLVIFVIFVEGVLLSGLMDDISIHWFPPKYQALDKSLYQFNNERSNRHPFNFNSSVKGFEKDSNTGARIAVLGDSFVWGNGLPFAEGWTRKFKHRVIDVAPSVEVLSWGRNGWSTKDELEFLENVATRRNMFDIDYLIVSFVINDPDLNDLGRREFRKEIDWQNNLVQILRKIVPNTVDFFTGHIDAVLEVFTNDYGYSNWLEYLWSEKNLKGYQDILSRFKSTLESVGIPFVFVLVPARPDEGYYREKFDRLEAIMDQLEISYLNLLPNVLQAFDVNYRGVNDRNF